MTRHHRILGIAVLALLCGATEALAQVPYPRPGRPPLTPAETRPAAGLMAGPTSRAADNDTGGLELAVFAEAPIDAGWRARGEIGAAIWETDPAYARGAKRVTLTRATAGLYRVHGRSRVHSFIGAGVGLYGHHLSGAPGSGMSGGAHGGMGLEYEGRRRGLSAEARIGLAPKSSTPQGGVLHASVLFGWKRVF
jgi:hypothetical protein